MGSRKIDRSKKCYGDIRIERLYSWEQENDGGQMDVS